MTIFKMGHIPCSNQAEAESIANALLERQLIACANIVSNITSLYRWQGKVQKDQETLLLIKTTQEHIETIMEIVRDLHSYECPCIITWAIEAGNKEYLDWAQAQITTKE